VLSRNKALRLKYPCGFLRRPTSSGSDLSGPFEVRGDPASKRHGARASVQVLLAPLRAEDEVGRVSAGAPTPTKPLAACPRDGSPSPSVRAKDERTKRMSQERSAGLRGELVTVLNTPVITPATCGASRGWPSAGT